VDPFTVMVVDDDLDHDQLGRLFLGAAEATLGIDDSWERVVIGRSSAYRPTAH
jgi:hypothetical protein